MTVRRGTSRSVAAEAAVDDLPCAGPTSTTTRRLAWPGMPPEPNGDRVPIPPEQQHQGPQPTPASWSLQRVGTGPGDQPFWAFTLHTVVGPVTTFWSADTLLRLVGKVRDEVTGLTVTGEMPDDPFPQL